ncbi:hypothetical protein EMIHUDRAFT_45764, partial [Emiliania huxleyi CCMP1516]|uniref:PDZ domain-containing protein n=2 Tax=Emiliania huxleyi TaxID=2903 RepID=A0A0D3K1K6_EMIH1
ELAELDDRRKAMEAEMEGISEALRASNMGGVAGALVDRDGFPRADVDVHATRTLRHRLACLNTDHKALMQQLEAKLHAMHAALAAGAPPPPPPAARPPPRTASVHAPPPFARVGSVAPGGPAAAAGLQPEDRLLRFGHVDASNHDGLRALALLTRRSEGGTIPLLVLRGASPLELTLSPRHWEGQGLLGCLL